MAHKKGVGSSKNGRESESKRLGVKLFGGEYAKAGNIIIRQRGTEHHPGENTGMGKDHTIYALIDGIVMFRKTKNNRSFISVQRIGGSEAEDTTKVAIAKPEAEAVGAEVQQPVVEAVATAAAESAPEAIEAVAEVAEAKAAVEKPKAKAAAKPKTTAKADATTAEKPAATKEAKPKKTAAKPNSET